MICMSGHDSWFPPGRGWQMASVQALTYDVLSYNQCVLLASNCGNVNIDETTLGCVCPVQVA